MNRMEISSIIYGFVEKLNKAKKFCGETHIQKAVYLFQEIMGINLNLGYILYKHGPFSFDLREKLSEMLAEEFLSLELKFPSPVNAPSYVIGEIGQTFEKVFKAMYQSLEDKIDFIVQKIGEKGAARLEQLSTALYFERKKPDWSDDKKASHINTLKPHISIDSAKDSIQEIKSILQEVTSN